MQPKIEKKILITGILLIIAILMNGCTRRELPQTAIARFINARLAYEDGDLGYAARELMSLVKDHKSFSQAELLLGKSLFFLNQLEDAKNVFENLYSNNPGLYEAGYWLGRTYVRLEEHSSAITQYRDLHSKYSIDFRIMHQLALLHMDRGEYTEALDYLRRSLLVRDELAQAALTLGQLYYSQNLYQEAIDSLQAAQELATPSGPIAFAADQILVRIQRNPAGEGSVP